MDTKHKELFNYLKPIFERHLSYLQEMHTALDLSIQGIHGLKSLLPGIAKAYEKGDMSADLSKMKLNEIHTNLLTRTSLASSEIERGFPILYSHATIALWSAIDVFSTDLAVGLLQCDSDLLTLKAFSKIRVQLATFLQLSEEERFALLITELRHSLNGAADGGIGQHNEVFVQLGLDGSLHKSIQETLVELCQVRNVLVHRGGVVDAQLTNRCPWLKLDKGTKLVILKPSYEKYWAATHKYWLDLINRVRVRTGMSAVTDT